MVVATVHPRLNRESHVRGDIIYLSLDNAESRGGSP